MEKSMNPKKGQETLANGNRYGLETKRKSYSLEKLN